MMNFFTTIIELCYNAIALIIKCIAELLQHVAEIFAYLFVIKKTANKLKKKNKK